MLHTFLKCASMSGLRSHISVRRTTDVFSHCWQAQQSLMCSICCFHIEVRTCNLRSDYKQELYVCVFLRQLISFSFFLRWKLQTVIWHYFYLKQGSLRFILSWWLRCWKSLAFLSPFPSPSLTAFKSGNFCFLHLFLESSSKEDSGKDCSLGS